MTPFGPSIEPITFHLNAEQIRYVLCHGRGLEKSLAFLNSILFGKGVNKVILGYIVIMSFIKKKKEIIYTLTREKVKIILVPKFS